MPNQPKTAASSFRFDDALLRLMDDLAEEIADERGLKCSRSDVVRIAVKEMAARRRKRVKNKSDKIA